MIVVFLFVSFGRTQWLQPLHRTKQKQTTSLACVVVLVVSLVARLFICLLACLFVCLMLFSFVSFLIYLLFDDRCSSKCQNIDEYFDEYRQNDKILKIAMKNDINLVCAFKTHNFWGVASGSDNDCKCFYDVNFVCAF